jgi:hypothetical protein
MGERMLRRRRAVGAMGAGMMALALAGCGAPPWAQGGGQASPSPTRSASIVPVPVPAANDLSSGSTERQVNAGAISATIDYWSTLAMDRWTATALKPVSISMATTVTPNDGQKVYLQRATMTAVPGNETQSFAPLAPQVDQSNPPGYLVLAPYSYSQTFNVGEVPAEATFVTLQFTYEYLLQTTPTSNEFAKQTASDSITVAIAREATPSG